MANEALKIEDAVNETCPWSGKPIAADSLTLYRGFTVGFCNPGCRDKFDAATPKTQGGPGFKAVPSRLSIGARTSLNCTLSGSTLSMKPAAFCIEGVPSCMAVTMLLK